MNAARLLRARFLSAIAASGAVVVACGGSVAPVGGGDEGSSGGGGSSGSTPTGTSSSSSSSGASGSTPVLPPKPPPVKDASVDVDDPVTCSYGKPDDECFAPGYVPPLGPGGDGNVDASAFPTDPNGCVAASSMHNGCCNPAVAGPTFVDGKCCYTFCTGACCGRPFVVDGGERQAPVVAGRGWAPVFVKTTEVVDPRIAAAWARDAAMEHASIASFARFTLDLLAHGAPAELVLAAQDATKDEVRHAQACFAIASRLARRELTAGALDVSGAIGAPDVEALVAATVTEGCVGETLSALLAEARLAQAEDDDVRTALAAIAEEEARHAELAWRVVTWAIETFGDRARHAARAAFGRALGAHTTGFDAVLTGLPSSLVRAHGLLDEATAIAVTEQAFDEVIGPCALELAGRVSSRPAAA